MLFERKDKKFLRNQQQWCDQEQERITDGLALIDRLERDGRADAEVLARKQELLAAQEKLCKYIAENATLEMALRGPTRHAQRHITLAYIFLLIGVGIATKIFLDKPENKKTLITEGLIAFGCGCLSCFHVSKNDKYRQEALDILQDIQKSQQNTR